MAVENLLDTIVTITRKVRLRAGGHLQETYQTVGTAACRVSHARANDIAIVGQKEGAIFHNLYVMPGTDIRIGDRLQHEAGMALDVRVANAAGPSPTYPYVKVICEEYQRG